MEVQIKIVLVITGLHIIIQSYYTKGNIYHKVQLDVEHLLMHLSYEKIEVKE